MTQPQLFPEPHWREQVLPKDFPRRERLMRLEKDTLGLLWDAIYGPEADLRLFTIGELCEIETALDQCREAWERRQDEAKARS